MTANASAGLGNAGFKSLSFSISCVSSRELAAAPSVTPVFRDMAVKADWPTLYQSNEDVSTRLLFFLIKAIGSLASHLALRLPLLPVAEYSVAQ